MTKNHKQPMVGWYNPIQLGKTAGQVAISMALGTRADYRIIEALAEDQGQFDYSSKPELWIDYVADTGDGWNSTYAVASLLARSEFVLTSPSDRNFETRRGNIVIMGGDEVYPTASRENYQARLVEPFETALKFTDPPHPHLFAIPGNHDWYDGLVSFTRLFCQERWIGGWQTQQRRSYFALRLPHHWWLIGVDVHLESDIDKAQLDYFRQVAAKMEPGDRIILCTAEPDWIYGNIYDPRLENNLAFLERRVFEKAQVVVTLAGDLHHYRRHEATDGTRAQKITAGGGGAFLHPTHGEPVDTIVVGPSGQRRTFTLRSEFPDRRTSRRLAWRNVAFPLWNPKFGLITATAYLMVAWVLPQRNILWRLLHTPSALMWMFLLVAGFWLFTDTHKRWYRYTAGTLHGLAHLGTAYLTVRIAAEVTTEWFHMSVRSVIQPLTAGMIVFVLGYIFGSVLMGLYLFISLNGFQRHANEAFSSLRIQDYKNFLRLHIDHEGHLAIYPVGITQVPRQWISATPMTDRVPQLVPAQGQSLVYGLIEEPVEIP